MKLIAKFESGASTTTAETISTGNTGTSRPKADNVPAAAKNLALAYRIADLIDRGLVADFTAAARLLGVSQPRLTHVMSLLLAPQIQEVLLRPQAAGMGGDGPVSRRERLGGPGKAADCFSDTTVVACIAMPWPSSSSPVHVGFASLVAPWWLAT